MSIVSKVKAVFIDNRKIKTEGGGGDESGKEISCIISSDDNFDHLIQNNRFIGVKPILKNSIINFQGKNNILYCEDNVSLVNSSLTFNGSNSVIYLSSNRYDYKLKISIHNDSACFIGKNNYMNGTVNIILSEQRHVYIGSEGLFSFGIWIRNADPHLLYSSETMKRINPTKSIFIGNHVWIGQSTMILKGTKINSGSILGAMCLVAGKVIPSNTAWGGNPAKLLKTDVFWEGSSVHFWTEEKTENSQTFESDKYIFSNNTKIDFEEIDTRLSMAKTSMDKLSYLLELKKTVKM